MPIKTRIFIEAHCDGFLANGRRCGMAVNQAFRDESEARRVLKECGWTVSELWAFCPSCRPVRKVVAM